MPSRHVVPAPLAHRPFTPEEAAAHGVTRHVLRGASYRRLFPRVWVHVDHVMTTGDWILAAHLTLPRDARLTGITRVQQLGLDHGSQFPLHFVVARDHHIATDGIMLHRTDRMPFADDLSVVPTAAFIAYCSEATVLDAIIVGDWLLREDHITLPGLLELARHDHWRHGSAQAVWIAPYLDARSASPGESELRASAVFAGLPAPELNVPLTIRGRTVIVDLAWLLWKVIVEYEGAHHQADRRQYLHDIDRYGLLRVIGLDYLQVTKEQMRNIIAVITKLHAALVAGGYPGPAPQFGRHFRRLYGRIPAAPTPRAVHGR
ncbi:hypothetical protein [Aeromicrobium sp. Sec7.5]|uniref:hypothetical protein n=1 Tax=Aeromicrobium sp. Sec7.5 TaxID=3121276 RepID=UPI002FE48E82